jgi:hypothetical protein
MAKVNRRCHIGTLSCCCGYSTTSNTTADAVETPCTDSTVVYARRAATGTLSLTDQYT